MEYTFHIYDSNPKAKAFLEFIKTLDFVHIGKSDAKLPNKTKEEIIQQALNTEKEIINGKVIAHNDLVSESKNW